MRSRARSMNRTPNRTILRQASGQALASCHPGMLLARIWAWVLPKDGSSQRLAISEERFLGARSRAKASRDDNV